MPSHLSSFMVQIEFNTLKSSLKWRSTEKNTHQKETENIYLCVRPVTYTEKKK